MPKKKSVKKKVAKKKTAKKKTTSRKRKTTPKVVTEKIQIQMQPIFVDNFVSLQKVMMNLAEKLSDTTTKIDKLLEIFETSAKALAKKDFKLAGETSPEIMKKLNDLSEQNKTIARGLTLLHEPAPQEPMPMPAPRPMMSMPPMPKSPPGMPPTPTPKGQTGLEQEQFKKSTSFKALKPKTSK